MDIIMCRLKCAQTPKMLSSGCHVVHTRPLSIINRTMISATLKMIIHRAIILQANNVTCLGQPESQRSPPNHGLPCQHKILPIPVMYTF